MEIRQFTETAGFFAGIHPVFVDFNGNSKIFSIILILSKWCAILNKMCVFYIASAIWRLIEGVRNVTKQELQKLTRLDLIEMLLQATRDNERLRSDLEHVRRQLEDREAAIGASADLAEATLRLNGVVEAAQAAADQYLENIRLRNDRQDIYIRMKQDTLEKCTRMIDAAQAQVDDYLNHVHNRLRLISELSLLEQKDL